MPVLPKYRWVIHGTPRQNPKKNNPALCAKERI
jgi:hypothetical protein